MYLLFLTLLAKLNSFQADSEAKALGISFATFCPGLFITDMTSEAFYSDGSKLVLGSTKRKSTAIS